MGYSFCVFPSCFALEKTSLKKQFKKKILFLACGFALSGFLCHVHGHGDGEVVEQQVHTVLLLAKILGRQHR